MSADRLSFTSQTELVPGLLHWPALGRRLNELRRRDWGAKMLVGRRSELLHEGFGNLIYYSAGQERTGERPLLLLHGMQLHAGAHTMQPLYDAFRARRKTYALDLPGFAGSDAGAERTYDAELYITAIKHMVEHCACEEVDSVDVVAVGLTSEYAARATAALPDMVHSLTLIDPTGFALERDETVLERLARRGTAFLPYSVLTRVGLSQFCDGGFASVLNGAAFPRENPQAVYTRVHCPTLVLHARARATRYGALARFVRWREHYSEQELDSTSLRDRRAAARIEAELVRFYAAACAQVESQELELRAG